MMELERDCEWPRCWAPRYAKCRIQDEVCLDFNVFVWNAASIVRRKHLPSRATMGRLFPFSAIDNAQEGLSWNAL